MLRQKATKPTKVTKKAAKRSPIKQRQRNVANNAAEGYQGPTFGKSTLSRQFPDVKAQQVLPDGSVKPFSTEDLNDGYSVVVAFPLAFTFVCPTEINALSDAMPKFKEMGVKVYGLSVDSAFALQAWQKQPKKEGGIEGCQVPLIADLSREVSSAMGALLPNNITCRATMIFKDGILRNASFFEPSVGRSVDEIIRVCEAIQAVDTNGGVAPCGFKKGSKLMTPTQEGLKKYVSDV